MPKQQRTYGIMIIQLSLAIYMVVTGLCLFGVGSSISSEEISTLIGKLGSAGKILGIIIGFLLVICGVIFCLKIFGLIYGKFVVAVKYITLILWSIITIATLVFLIKEVTSILILHWLLVFAKNGLIIGGILTIKNGQ